MATAEQHFDVARKYQEFYDNTLRQVGMRAPQPILNQSVNDYRRETLRMMKHKFLPQNHPLFKIQMRSLQADALQVLEPQVMKASVEEVHNPNTVTPGEFRRVDVLDESGTLRMRKFIGPESFVKAMGRPGRRVVGFFKPLEKIRY